MVLLLGLGQWALAMPNQGYCIARCGLGGRTASIGGYGGGRLEPLSMKG
jgi:hypothetical protein